MGHARSKILLILSLLGGVCHAQPMQKNVRIGLREFPGHLDPKRYALLSYSLIIKSLHRGLVQQDESGTFRSDLANTWQIKDNHSHYIFCLGRKRFQNGAEVTARDIQFTLDRLKDPKGGFSSYKSVQKMNPQVKPLKDNHPGQSKNCVSIKLSSSYPQFLELLVRPEYSIVSADSKSNEFPVGAGDYRLTRLDLSRKTFSIEKNTETEDGQIDMFTFQEIVDEAIAGKALEDGLLDAYFGWQDYQSLKALLSKIDVSNIPTYGYIDLFFNAHSPIARSTAIRSYLAARLSEILASENKDSTHIFPIKRLLPPDILLNSDRKPGLKPVRPMKMSTDKLRGKTIKIVLCVNELSRVGKQRIESLFAEFGANVRFEFSPEKYVQYLENRDYDLIFGGTVSQHYSMKSMLAPFRDKSPYSMTNFAVSFLIDDFWERETKQANLQRYSELHHMVEELESRVIAVPGFAIKVAIPHSERLIFPSRHKTPLSLAMLRYKAH